ncbi:MAG: amidohydrolase family protein [Steroidobacteraceae bacterium]
MSTRAFGILRRALLAGLLAAPALAAQTQEARAPGAIVFVHVNLVPMDSQRMLPDETVVVENGRIVRVGVNVAVPPGAQVMIDGHRRAFLSPGLADMHTHSDTKRDLEVYLANGVTSLLNMGGARAPFIDRTMPAVNAGTIPGPHVYAAFRVDGSPRYGNFVVTTPDEARWVVRLAKTNGYSFIKVYNDLSPECFQALVEEGRAQGLPVVGHGVTQVGLERQLDAGQVMVAHTEEFLYTTFASRPGEAQDPAPSLDEIPHAIAFILRDHAYVTADLNTYATIARQWGKPAVVAGFLGGPEARYLDPQRRLQWKDDDYVKRSGSLAAKLEFLKRFTKAMSDAGVPLITGTDAPPIPGLVPGFSLQDDLRALVQAGLTPYQALAAATRTPGEFISRSLPGAEKFGVVLPGYRADLVLTEGNPLDGLATLRRPLGVMAAGHWYPRARLQGMLEAVARDYQSVGTVR